MLCEAARVVPHHAEGDVEPMSVLALMFMCGMPVLGAALGLLASWRAARRCGKGWVMGVGAAIGAASSLLAMLALTVLSVLGIRVSGMNRPDTVTVVLLLLTTLVAPLLASYLCAAVLTRWIARRYPDAKPGGDEHSYQRDTDG